MSITIDNSLNADRIDASTGTCQQEFDLHISMLTTTCEPAAAVTAYVSRIGSVFSSAGHVDDPRVQCISYALDRNAVSVVVTSSGWNRWKAGIVNASEDKNVLCELFSRDLLSVTQEYFRAHKAEGTFASIATFDVAFPCGKAVHWAGRV